MTQGTGATCWIFEVCERRPYRVFRRPARKSHPAREESYLFICDHHMSKWRKSKRRDWWREVTDPELKVLIFVMHG